MRKADGVASGSGQRYNPDMKISAPARLFMVGAMAVSACAAVLNLHAQEEGRGRKYKAPPPVSHLVITVYRGKTDKPVQDAAVIFHTIHDGKDQGNMELKTNEDGQATLDLIPMGDQVQLQVFKAGYKTYGEDFVNTDASREFTVRLLRPNGQYSTYQSAPVDANGDTATPQPTQGASKPTPK